MKNGTAEEELFGKKPVFEAVIRLAVPTVIGQIILVIYNMADTFFIGLTESDAMLTAVTVCMPAFMFLSAISNLFGVGGSSVLSRALGCGQRQRVKSASEFAFWGCIAVTLAYSVLAWLFMDPFVNLLGGSDPMVHEYSCEYLECTVVFGGLATALNMLLSHLVRSEGHSAQASAGIIIGGVLNICLDPLFMFVLLPPGRETLGAALATALSNAIAALYYVALLVARRKKTCLSFAPGRKMLAGHIPADVLGAGLPACLMTLFENISYAVLDKLMSLNGIAAQAGIGVAKKVNMLAHCIVRGIAQGVLPLIGYNYASGNHRRMRSCILLSTTLAVSTATLCMTACLIFARPFIGIFIQDEASASALYGIRFLRILCVGGPFSACAYSFISFFQGTGKSLFSFLLAILRKGILDIPLMFVLNSHFPIYGIVAATPIADTVCCITAICLFTLFLRKHTNIMDKEEIHRDRHKTLLADESC